MINFYYSFINLLLNFYCFFNKLFDNIFIFNSIYVLDNKLNKKNKTFEFYISYFTNFYILNKKYYKICVKNNIGVYKIFTDLDEALNVIEKTILLYKDQGIKGERFEETIKRIGFENVEEQLLSDDLLNRKEEILNKELALAK